MIMGTTTWVFGYLNRKKYMCQLPSYNSGEVGSPKESSTVNKN
jgi:hypothetical protein